MTCQYKGINAEKRCSASITACIFTSSGLTPHISSSATDVCFARQQNVSDNNNQCFSSANGHLPNSMAAQRPGAIDNQPLVTTEPMKVRLRVLRTSTETRKPLIILLPIKMTAKVHLINLLGK